MSRLLPGLAAACLLGGCATSSVTLLPTEDGRQSAVAVIEEKGKPVDAEISTVNSRTALSAKPKPKVFDPDKMKPKQRGLLGILPPPAVRLTLYFVQGTTTLTPESLPSLDYLKQEVARRPGVEVQVTGYTDTVGSFEDNDVLSQQRAEEVLTALTAQGIDPAVMSAVGRGERDLREPTEDNVSNAANRRVEVVIR